MAIIELPRGVYPRPSKYSEQLSYYSKIMVGKKVVWLGTFKDPSEAAEKYLKAKNKLNKNGAGTNEQHREC